MGRVAGRRGSRYHNLSPEEFGELLGDIYYAAVEQEGWRRCLEAIRSRIRARRFSVHPARCRVRSRSHAQYGEGSAELVQGRTEPGGRRRLVNDQFEASRTEGDTQQRQMIREQAGSDRPSSLDDRSRAPALGLLEDRRFA